MDSKQAQQTLKGIALIVLAGVVRELALVGLGAVGGHASPDTGTWLTWVTVALGAAGVVAILTGHGRIAWPLVLVPAGVWCWGAIEFGLSVVEVVHRDVLGYALILFDFILSVLALLAPYVLFVAYRTFLRGRAPAVSLLTWLAVVHLAAGGMDIVSIVVGESGFPSDWLGWAGLAAPIVLGGGLLGRSFVVVAFALLGTVALSGMYVLGGESSHVGSLAPWLILLIRSCVPLAIAAIVWGVFGQEFSEAAERRRWASEESSSGGSYGGTVTYQTTSKSCGNCSAPLPLSASVGGTCPRCGVRWGGEQTITRQDFVS